MVVTARREFGPCPKCGELDPEISWRPSGTSLRCHESHVSLGEHFDITCRRCEYRSTAPIDAPQAATSEADDA